MKIEEGKYYLDKAGEVVGPVRKNTNQSTMKFWPWKITTKSYVYTYTNDGIHGRKAGESSGDLVKEHTPNSDDKSFTMVSWSHLQSLIDAAPTKEVANKYAKRWGRVIAMRSAAEVPNSMVPEIRKDITKKPNLVAHIFGPDKDNRHDAGWYFATCGSREGYLAYLKGDSMYAVCYVAPSTINGDVEVKANSVILNGLFSHVERMATEEEVSKVLLDVLLEIGLHKTGVYIEDVDGNHVFWMNEVTDFVFDMDKNEITANGHVLFRDGRFGKVLSKKRVSWEEIAKWQGCDLDEIIVDGLPVKLWKNYKRALSHFDEKSASSF